MLDLLEGPWPEPRAKREAADAAKRHAQRATTHFPTLRRNGLTGELMANKTSNRGKGRPDVNQLAHQAILIATGQMEKPKEQEKNPAAVTLGRLGGLKGGKARAEKLSPAKRKAIAKKAAQARWGKS